MEHIDDYKTFESNAPRRWADIAYSEIKRNANAFKEEGIETGEMAKTFFNMLSVKLNLKDRKDLPTKKEIEEAVQQLGDVGKLSLVGAISILPGGLLGVLGLEALARKFGIKASFLPKAFRKKK
jgi:hypothetical protein